MATKGRLAFLCYESFSDCGLHNVVNTQNHFHFLLLLRLLIRKGELFVCIWNNLALAVEGANKKWILWVFPLNRAWVDANKTRINSRDTSKGYDFAYLCLIARSFSVESFYNDIVHPSESCYVPFFPSPFSSERNERRNGKREKMLLYFWTLKLNGWFRGLTGLCTEVKQKRERRVFSPSSMLPQTPGLETNTFNT